MKPLLSKPIDVRSRRQFLKTSTAVATGAITGSLAMAQHAHAAGSDRIAIGLVGCGKRGTAAASQAMNTQKIGSGSVRLVAMGDAFLDNVERRYRALSKRYVSQIDVPPERRFYGLDSYKRVLECDCDLVILATPPGFRPLHFEAAVNAGRHVFMEKPVATDPAGVRQVLAACKIAKQNNLAVAVGLQRRHEDRYRQTIARLQDGAIGPINLARAYWNGAGIWVRPRTPEQTEMEYQIRNWYYFNWLSGDHITEQHIHNLDVINWLKAAYPVEANGMGGREVRTGHDHGEIYDHHFVEYTYADGTRLYSQCRHIPHCWGNVSEHAHGCDGYCNIQAGTIHDNHGNRVWQFGKGGGDGHQQEHFDLFAGLRSGCLPQEGEYGALSTMTAIMGRMATYSGTTIRWDEAIESTVTLGIRDFESLAESPPVLPDANGRYAIPAPGKTRVV